MSDYVIANLLAQLDPYIRKIGEIKNSSLLAATTLTWNGALTSLSTTDIDVPNGDKVLIRINNTADHPLTVSFEHKVSTDYIGHYTSTGGAIAFTVSTSTSEQHVAYGPFENWPRFDGGRLIFTSTAAPTTSLTTIVQVQEV